jgi:uncharacterized protein (TIGR00369 family)
MLTIPKDFSQFEKSGPFLDLVGPLFARTNEHGLVLGIRVEQRHCNRRGFAHGGLLMTLADLALGYASGHGSEDKALLTISLNADFAGSAQVGEWIEAHVDVQQSGRSLAFANCYLSVDGRRLVRASGIFKVVSRG